MSDLDLWCVKLLTVKSSTLDCVSASGTECKALKVHPCLTLFYILEMDANEAVIGGWCLQGAIRLGEMRCTLEMHTLGDCSSDFVDPLTIIEL